MRKSAIWLLSTVLLMALIGLLYMQVKYISSMYESRNEHFSDAVRKALSQVNRELERDEINRLIDNDLLSLTPEEINDLRPSKPNISIDPKGFKLDQLPIDQIKTRQVRSDRFLDTSRLLQSQLKSKLLYFRELMIEYAVDRLVHNQHISFYERVNQQQLEEYLQSCLTDAGVKLHYVYEVVDRNNQVFFSSGPMPKDRGGSVYTQALFINDNPSDLHFLRVHFPGKNRYLQGSIDFLVPSIIFTILLFITAVFTIVVMYRQKKLAELKTDFINNMTHELKTPVSTIVLGTQMLRDTDVDKTPQVYQQVLGSIAEEGKRLQFLIEKVLQMSLFDKENVMLKRKEVDVQEMILNIANTYSITTESYGGDIEIELDADQTDILADEMHLTNVLFNLLDNAIKYRKPDVPPHLIVGTFNEGNMFCIYVQDNGIGIKKEYLKKVFDRFFRVPTGNRHDVKGFGLGLAYVAKVVHMMQGTIRAESELGEGTKFIISLPLITSK